MPTALTEVHQCRCGMYPREAQSLWQGIKKSLVTQYSAEEREYAVLKPLVTPVKAALVYSRTTAT